MKFLKRNFATIILSIIFVVGIGLIGYPTVANWWNQNKASHAVANYDENISNLNEETYNALISSARDYNEKLKISGSHFNVSDSEHERYINELSVNGSNMIGTIQIPTAEINLPIYHGTSDDVLLAGAGHLEGSSLPVGGIGTHTVITGHRGLPSAQLFTDLDKVAEGDYIIIRVLNEILTYKVSQIRIVQPQEIDDLAINPNKDLCTLVTCTPYGVNSHRMLVTGERVENISEWETVSDAGQIDTKMVALFIAVPILVGLFIWLMIYYRKPRGDSDEEDKNNSNQ